MSIKNFTLKKWSTKEEVNSIIGEYITLEDDVYLGNNIRHRWKCKRCGNIFEKKWMHIRACGIYYCKDCKQEDIENRYRTLVSQSEDYEYVRSFRMGEVLPSGTVVGESPVIQVKHKYCGETREVRASGFKNIKKCPNCCGSYEKSFAYYIIEECKVDISSVWDFEKNIKLGLNPFKISRGSSIKAWIKCRNKDKKDYHKSFLISLSSYKINGCPYCSIPSESWVHPNDSFAQYHIDNTDPNFLINYWDWEKNDDLGIDPWKTAQSSGKKVWIKCQNEETNIINKLKKKEYHGSYLISCDKFTAGGRCNKCNKSTENSYIHPYDSFGYHFPLSIQSWSNKNPQSPFKVSPYSNINKIFICPICNKEFKRNLNFAMRTKSIFCSECNPTHGEGEIIRILREKNIHYVYDQVYFKDLRGTRGGALRPDFILPDHKVWIEYDGEFHFKESVKTAKRFRTKEDYQRQVANDRIKDEYAKKHGYKMIRIPYWEFDNIENILKYELGL